MISALSTLPYPDYDDRGYGFSPVHGSACTTAPPSTQTATNSFPGIPTVQQPRPGLRGSVGAAPAKCLHRSAGVSRSAVEGVAAESAWHAGTADGNAGMEAQIALGSSPKRSVRHAVRTDGKNAATSNHGLCRAGYPAGGGRSAQESPESALVPLDGEAHEPKNTSMGTLCFQ